MRYVVKYYGGAGGCREAARQLAELRAARRELKAARQKIQSRG